VDLASTHQVFKHFHQRWRAFERVITTVQQVQVDALEPQATQTSFAFALNGTGVQGPGVLLIPHWILPELGHHYDALLTTSQGFTQDTLAQTLSVVIRCIE
jgi:hypothetical protein